MKIVSTLILAILLTLASCTTTLLPTYTYEEELNVRYSGTDFRKMDSHALKAPVEAESSVSTLAAYLVEPAENDWEKVRGIYAWVAHNISYDMAMFNDRVDYEVDVDYVLNARSSVCAGYANLMQALCDEVGLVNKNLKGYARGMSVAEAYNVSSPNHAWNAVEINGEWHLFDATWSSGEVKGFATDHSYDNYWFDTPPEEFIFSHLPTLESMQLMDEPVDAETFAAWPDNVEGLFRLGITPEEFLAYFNSSEYDGFPMIYDWGGAPVRRAEIPLSATLKAGESYEFVFDAPHFYGMAYINNGDWTIVNPVDGVYRKTIRPKSGELIVLVKGSGNQYNYITIYDVRR